MTKTFAIMHIPTKTYFPVSVQNGKRDCKLVTFDPKTGFVGVPRLYGMRCHAKSSLNHWLRNKSLSSWDFQLTPIRIEAETGQAT